MKIRANWEKSDLMLLNSNNKSKIQMENITITPLEPNDTIRYLEVYFNGKGSSSPNKEKILNKMKLFHDTIIRKRINHIQAADIFQVVIRPHIEYLLQTITLDSLLTKTFNTLIKKIIKIKARVNNKTQNLTFNNIINKYISEIQEIYIIANSNLLRRLRKINNKTLNKTIQICLKDWKHQAWFHSINQNEYSKFIKETKNNWIAHNLVTLDTYNIKLNKEIFLLEESLISQISGAYSLQQNI
ncbi:23639_t:CDS:1 [Entrophospora sp. SA101]|nr:6219_t:CDS:1 [Entrophospora sp. SA101]CAJ0752384.1 23639_t:CDS:1 [Entrophospora sp. SA101]